MTATHTGVTCDECGDAHATPNCEFIDCTPHPEGPHHMNTTPETGSVSAAIVTRNGRAYCRACGTNACPHIQEAHRARLIYAPTIATLRALLDDMERAGVNPNTRVRVDHLTNAPGTFNVQPLADTLNDVRIRDAYGI